MMFVRAASNYEEQNTVAYQFEEDIYFSTTKNVAPKEELRVRSHIIYLTLRKKITIMSTDIFLFDYS